MSIRPFIFALACIFASAAGAHTRLQASTPADHSVLSEMPKQITLHFSEATHLTALTIQKTGEKTEEAISVLPKGASQLFTIPLALSGVGEYTVTWRALGDDNHVTNGVVHFTVKPNG